MSVKSEVQKLEPSSLIELFQLDGTVVGGEILYFHANPTIGSIWWQDVEYSPWPLNVEGFARTSDRPPQPKLSVANLDGSISELCRIYDDMVGCKVTRIRTFGKFLDPINFGKKNLLKYSEDLTNTVWVKSSGIVITANNGVDPTGAMTADLVDIQATNQYIYQTVNVDAEKDYTFSVHVAASTFPANQFKIAVYDFSNSQWIQQGISSDQVSSTWTRQEVSFKTPVDCTEIGVYIYRNPIGAGLGTMYLWGAQLELGVFATDYQPKDDTGRNAEANPDEEFPREVWFIDRKSGESVDMVQFELASAFDLNGVNLPRRQIVANYCSWKSIGGYRGPYCAYIGPPVARIDGTPTTNPDEDDCGGKISDCKLRDWPDDVLNFGGFPAAGLIRT